MREEGLPFFSRLREEVDVLFFLWKLYLKNVMYILFYRHRAFRLGVVSMIVVGSIVCFLREVLYAQSGMVVESHAYYYPLERLVSWIMYGGLLGVIIGSLRKNYLMFKRWFDIFVSVVSLIVLFPLFVMIFILIKMDSSGPVFFRQKRLGRKDKVFTMWKFRTMRENAELETGPVWAQEDDPRITKIGKFLRKTQLDKLPQLFNVLKGDMALVGPCPERPEFLETITEKVPEFNLRTEVKPGITGLAQARYKYADSVKDAASKLRYDLLYIEKMCWLLDFKIILWTLENALTGEGGRR